MAWGLQSGSRGEAAGKDTDFLGRKLWGGSSRVEEVVYRAVTLASVDVKQRMRSKSWITVQTVDSLAFSSSLCASAMLASLQFFSHAKHVLTLSLWFCLSLSLENSSPRNAYGSLPHSGFSSCVHSLEKHSLTMQTQTETLGTFYFQSLLYFSS